jgi:peptidoglycan/LPS O-acetylase OafA/YrhL
VEGNEIDLSCGVKQNPAMRLARETLRGHIESLDSLRGIAAVVVLLVHVSNFIYFNFLTQEESHWLLTSHVHYLIQVLLNGPNMVSFFFVLSGFVLSYSILTSGKEVNFKAFVIRRVFRLFPLYWFVVITGHLLDGARIPVVDLLNELAMLPDLHKVIEPGWSMTVEFVCSMFVPFFALLLVKDRRLFFTLFLVICVFARHINPFFVHFMLGVGVAGVYFRNPEQFHIEPSRALRPIMLVAAALFVLMIEPAIRPVKALVGPLDSVLMLFGMHSAQELRGASTYLQAFLAAAGGAGIIYLVLRYKNLSSFLARAPFVFIGKISFGIYLVHWIFIYYFPVFRLEWFKGNLLAMYLGCGALVLAASIISGTILHYLVELPFIRLGKKVAMKWAISDANR